MIKMIVKSHLFLVAFLFTSIVQAQSIEGRVRDAMSGDLLVGATVNVIGTDNGSVSDAQGNFKINNISSGLYDLEISYIGYFTFVEKEVWVKAGKVTFVEVGMQQNESELEAVEVSAAPLAIPAVSSFGITEEKINRYAASYNDPARLVTAISDVAVANDQNNQISVRGISPIYNVWRLEGVEIVNPNHLSNAGTFNDQPAATGGGVNILSAQMLDKSEFKYGAMDNSASNVVGGLFDMSLRDGYAGDYQFTGQASFIGFDMSAEGPLVKEKPASFLVNYRYSFTGLLGAMGVDFGGEKIGFQDLSFNVNTPFKNGASLKVFGMGGLSHNYFEAKTFAESEIQKDRSDIDYDAAMGAVGLKYETPIGDGKARLSFSSVYSALENERDEILYDEDESVANSLNNPASSRIFSNSLELLHPIGRQHSFSVGANVNLYKNFEGYFFEKQLIAPYSNLQLNFNNRFQINTGVTLYRAFSDDDNLTVIDFRLATLYRFNQTTISASAGHYSQLIVPGKAFIRSRSGTLPFEHLAMIKSERYLFGIRQDMGSLKISLEGFYYYFPNVLSARQFYTLGKPIDLLFEFPDQAKSLGFNISLEKELEKNYYYRLGATIFESTYKFDLSKRTNDNPYNTQHSFHFIAGKKWEFSNDTKKRSLSVNTKGIYQGGLFQESFIYSDSNGRLVINEERDRLNPYARLDFRIQWMRYRPKSTTSWSLDIQNLTNRQNEAFQYYDSFTGQVEMNYQLGMIPILTYRIEF